MYFSDNGNELVNTNFRTLLVKLGIKVEHTAVDGAKRNGHVERRIAFVTEAAKTLNESSPSSSPIRNSVPERSTGLPSGTRRSREPSIPSISKRR